MKCSRSVLKYFMQYIHFNKLNNIPEKTLNNKEEAFAIGTDVVRLWILASKHFIPGLHNRALKILHYFMDNGGLQDVMGRIFEHEQEFVWQNTVENSKLREFFMDWVSTCPSYKVSTELSGRWTSEMWQEIYENARKLLRNKTGRQPLKWYYSRVPEEDHDGTPESRYYREV